MPSSSAMIFPQSLLFSSIMLTWCAAQNTKSLNKMSRVKMESQRHLSLLPECILQIHTRSLKQHGRSHGILHWWKRLASFGTSKHSKACKSAPSSSLNKPLHFTDYQRLHLLYSPDLTYNHFNHCSCKHLSHTANRKQVCRSTTKHSQASCVNHTYHIHT